MELWALKYQLSNASPEYVFDWLKNNTVEKHRLGDDDRGDLEKSLLAKNNKLINLGLALYGEMPDVGYGLYQTGDPVLKRAALAGRSVKPIFLDECWALNDDVLPVLLQEEKDAEEIDEGKTLLHELLNNKFLPGEIIEEAFGKEGHFKNIDDDTWISVAVMAARNERLSTAYNSSWMDGFDEYRYTAVFCSAWRLFAQFPKTKRAAYALSLLAAHVVADKPHDMDVMEIVERWRSEDEKEEEAFADVRSNLIKILGTDTDEFKLLKDHRDLALRKGYYENLQWPKPDEVKNGFEKDGKDFLDAAIYNKKFYYNPETRAALRQACREAPDENHYMDYPNYFNSQSEFLASKYPEWFKDEYSGEVSFSEIEDSSERSEKRIEYMCKQISVLHHGLLGNKSEYQDTNEFGENSVFNDLRSELQQIGEHLGKLYQKKSFSWGWLAAGLAVGYIFARL